MYKDLMTINSYRLRLAVDACIDHHYVIAQRVLRPETAGVLRDVCSRLEYRPNLQMAVFQQFEYVKFTKGEWPEELQWLVAHVEDMVRGRARARARCGLMRWNVNEIVVQRYASYPHEGPPYAIEWHRDFARDKLLVAIFTVSGLAQFEIETAESGIKHYLICPGDLTLLAGPDVLTTHDPRLRHRVSTNLTYEPRISIALRMNLAERDGSLDYA